MPRRSDSTVGTTLSSNHRFMRLSGQRLVITECYFDFNLDVVPGESKPKQAELITRMKFWLDNVLEDCIVIPMDGDVDTNWMEGLDNTFMFSPTDPTDFLVHVMVHAKLHAIGAGLVNIIGSHMTSDHSNGFGIWFEGDSNELLPLQKDWMGERAYFALPWWHRGDASMVDIIARPEDDISKKPDIIVDWYQLMNPPEPESNGNSAEIIPFKPRIVN